MIPPLTISKEVARRYLLGRQGLWPSLRWKSKSGAAKAIHTLESVQMDPLVIISQSHHLVLHSRVLDYTPNHLDTLLYKDRQFFDYGGHLDIYPIEDLPFWRVHMRYRRAEARWTEWAAQFPSVISDVRQRIQQEGPLGPGDFAADGGARVQGSYRGSKTAGVALYYLWLTGELMTHSRRASERVYDLAERIAPAHLLQEASEEDAGRYLALQWLRSGGLTIAAAATSLVGFVFRYAEYHAARSTPEKAAAPKAFSGKERMAGLVVEGHAVPVRVEGVKDQYYAPAEDLPLFETLLKGQLPRAWKPLDPTAPPEVTFLSPLDNVLDRRRTKAVFDFDYTWEIYVKPEKRVYGAYTLPVLYGDQLVARIEARTERKTNALAIRGFWLENESLAKDPDFAASVQRGLTRLITFLALERADLTPTYPLTRPARALIARIIKTL